jgi:7-carboxy-7-deazaguanine synthase
MRRYSVNSIFGPTIQGEGPLTGIVCHFIRLSGCNMWDGRPETKSASLCPYCDTDFLAHTMMPVSAIVTAVQGLGPASTPGTHGVDWVWISGGEPYLQLDWDLVEALRQAGYKIAVETNGTVMPKTGVSPDLVTMSPKLPPAQTLLKSVNVLKVLYPHPNPNIRPEAYDDILAGSRYVQPIEDLEGPATTSRNNLDQAVQFVLEHPQWRLGVQIHKVIGVA